MFFHVKKIMPKFGIQNFSLINKCDLKPRFRLLFFCFVLLFTYCQQNKELPPNSPNFLIIMADDLDYSEIGCYGGEIPTPNIDQLAKEGILFTDFYTAKDDAKTRSMLLTGTSQAQVPSTHQLQAEAVTIAQLLKDVGYRTMMSGKWNLGTTKADIPIVKGFQQSFALMEEKCNHLGNKRYFPAIFRENNNIKEISEDFYTTQYFSRQLLSFFSAGKKKARKKPFFAYLSFTAPHYPLQAPARTIQNFSSQYEEGYQAIYEARIANQLALGLHTGIDDLSIPNWENLSPALKAVEAKKMEIYAAMVFDMDKHIGKLIDYLKVSKQYEHTVIIFLADGGISEPASIKQLAKIDNSLENMGNPNSMITLGKEWTSLKLGNKGNKGAVSFDNGVKAPLIISSPLLKEQAGNRDKTIRTVGDITPTILKMIGIPHPSESYFEDVLSVEGQPIF